MEAIVAAGRQDLREDNNNEGQDGDGHEGETDVAYSKLTAWVLFDKVGAILA